MCILEMQFTETLSGIHFFFLERLDDINYLAKSQGMSRWILVSTKVFWTISLPGVD